LQQRRRRWSGRWFGHQNRVTLIIKDLISTVRALIRIVEGDNGCVRVNLLIGIWGRLKESCRPR